MAISDINAGTAHAAMMLLQNEQPVCEILSLQDRGGLDFCYNPGFSSPLSSGRELYIATPIPPVADPAVSPVIEFTGDQKKWILAIGMVHFVAGTFWSKVTFMQELL